MSLDKFRNLGRVSLFELHGREAAENLRRHSSEMILVDGPTLDSGASRLGAVDLAAPFLCCDVTLYSTTLSTTPGCAWDRRGRAVATSWFTGSELREATLRRRGFV